MLLLAALRSGRGRVGGARLAICQFTARSKDAMRELPRVRITPHVDVSLGDAVELRLSVTKPE